MKPDIHPAVKTIQANCSCGNSFNVKSTLQHDLHLDVCYHCHPFYTGQQKIVDTGGRVDRFHKRYNKSKANTQSAA